jgi:predicted GIY-YIG superfamily endonuclease
MTIYLIHLLPKYKHARHYLGIANDVDTRFQAHRNGHGARLTQVAIEHGSELVIVRTWEGTREDERRLKRQKNAPRLCPLCSHKPRKGLADER